MLLVLAFAGDVLLMATAPEALVLAFAGDVLLVATAPEARAIRAL
jgi:hypothetical protein